MQYRSKKKDREMKEMMEEMGEEEGEDKIDLVGQGVNLVAMLTLDLGAREKRRRG